MSSDRQPQKRGLTLDLNSSPSKAKRTRLGVGAAGGAPPILTTPDVQMLKLSSPELAKFLSGNNGLPTPTPSGYAFPKTVTEEQELYAKGFEDALKNMHSKSPAATTATTTTSTATAIATIEKATAAHKAAAATATTTTASQPESNLIMAASAIAEQPPLPVSLPKVVVSSAASTASRPSSSASGSVDSQDLPDTVRIKEEVDDDDDLDEDGEDDEELSNEAGGSTSKRRGKMRGGPIASPINMETQEQIKLERKRMRNRVAASKCRRRKLERIAQLDTKVQQLKGENVELAGVVKKLKEAVCNLKQEVMDHMNSGCQIMVTDVSAL